MTLLELFVIAVGLSMDAFAVSVCKGLSVSRVKPVHAMTCGGYFHDFSKHFLSLEERKAFTYSQLGIADFIIPALYEGLFTRMFNMKGLVKQPFSTEERLIRLCGKRGDISPSCTGTNERTARRATVFIPITKEPSAIRGRLKM